MPSMSHFDREGFENIGEVSLKEAARSPEV